MRELGRPSFDSSEDYRAKKRMYGFSGMMLAGMMLGI
jgi:hypothetical protein